jgi:NodT family efflux transporter outer membrane factor (OMF) lipoprotein
MIAVRGSLFRTLLLASCALVAAGCSTTGPMPNLQASDIPPGFEQPAPADAPIWPDPTWWRGFASDELNAIIGAVEADNLSLEAAELRVLQADQRVRQAGATLLPSVDGGASFRTGLSGGRGEETSTSTSFGADIGASYDPDLFGANRAGLRAAEAGRRATRADREAVALTAVAGAANTYFQLLSIRGRLEIARLNLEIAQSVLQVTRVRVETGVADDLELSQQLGAIAGQLAQIPQLQQQEIEARAALALLTGRPPEGFDVAGQNLDAVAIPTVAPGLPSELLRRRPDLVAAEAGLEAAHADLAAARAALYPSISLSAGGGISSEALTDILSLPTFSLSLGASIAQTIFDAGARQAQSETARLAELEILANYRGTVHNALSEVESALANIRHLQEREMQLQVQAEQAQRAFEIIDLRYREGVADFLALLDAQRTLYGARDTLAGSKLARLQALIALYQALGGGWVEPAAD